MATRSAIAIKTSTGVRAIYCHWDGYLEAAGVTLQESYTTAEQINELMELGDLSTLADTPFGCEAYHRDRSEPFEQTRAREYSDREFLYVFLETGKWAVVDGRTYEFEGPQLLSNKLA
jgi:hypothetical protein